MQRGKLRYAYVIWAPPTNFTATVPVTREGLMAALTWERFRLCRREHQRSLAAFVLPLDSSTTHVKGPILSFPRNTECRTEADVTLEMGLISEKQLCKGQ